MNAGGGEPDLKRALRPVPTFERAVREVSRMFSEAGIRHALVGGLGANAYRNRPRTTEDINFLVGDEAFQAHPGGFVTMRVPVVEFDGIAVDLPSNEKRALVVVVRPVIVRHAARGASTPWYSTRLILGRGVSAANRSSSSTGSKTRCVVPSVHRRRSSSTVFSSGVTRNRSCPTGGRSAYRCGLASLAKPSRPSPCGDAANCLRGTFSCSPAPRRSAAPCQWRR